MPPGKFPLDPGSFDIVVSNRVITLACDDEAVFGGCLCRPANFQSSTYRWFQLEVWESACEDYGQSVSNKGSNAYAPHKIALDDRHAMQTGKVFEGDVGENPCC